jgi:PKD repeat protein
MSGTVTPTMVTCFGANDGKITITASAGGSGVYQYSKDGGTTWQGAAVFTNLAPASYDVRIRDVANTSCVITLNSAVVVTQPAVLSATISGTPVTCFGGADGTISISAPLGGYGTYEFSINGGGSWQASGSFSGLTPGSYNILIRDAANTSCVKVLNSAYSVTQPGLLSATVAKIDVTCNAANDGKITITSPTGGYGTYEYSINGGSSWQASGSYTGLVPGTYDVRIRDAANTACTVTLYPNLTITQPAVLTMSSTGNITLNCNGDSNGTGTFYAAGGSLPYTFSVVSNTTGATIAAPGFNSQQFFSAAAGAITVAVVDLHGCVATATINATQPAVLTPGTIGSDQVICSGVTPATLTETAPATGGPGAYTYQWQYSTSNAGPFMNLASATASTYTFTSAATNTLYYRRMVTSGVCTPVYSNVVEVKVNPLPVAMLTGGETICPAQTSILKVEMLVGTGPFEVNIQNHGIVTGYVSNSDIVVSPVAVGPTIYKLLSVKDANGCQVVSPSGSLIGTATVTVRALPAITASPVNKTICEFNSAAFNAAASGTDLTWQWYVDKGTGFTAIPEGGVYVGTTSSTMSIFGADRDMNGYIYHAVATSCSASVTSGDATLTVNTPPVIDVQPVDANVCTGGTTTFSVTASGTSPTYQWQVKIGAAPFANVSGPEYSGANTNTLTITGTPVTFNNQIYRVVVGGTCPPSVYSNFVMLRVKALPTVTLQPVDKSVCDGAGTRYFTANGTGVIDSLRWQVLNGATWTDIYDNAVYSGTNTQQLSFLDPPLSYNGKKYRMALKAACSTAYTNSATLTVFGNPVVTLTPVNACGGVGKKITPVISGGSGSWSQHTWTGDVGPLSSTSVYDPTFKTQVAAIYNLIYKVKDSNGCYGTGTVAVNVDSPDASFTQDKTADCTPNTVIFTKDLSGYASFTLDYGDGSPVVTAISATNQYTHQYINTTAATTLYRTVTLTVRSAGGCTDTKTSTITVYPAISATFTGSKTTICSGETITFSAIPGAASYAWTYGDGVSGTGTSNSTHLYTNTGSTDLSLTVSLTTTSFYGCVDTKTLNITVKPKPAPAFTPLSYTANLEDAGNVVNFTNATNAGTWTWAWNFGDGGTSSVMNPSHTYTAIGTYDVVLEVSNGTCSQKVTHQVVITPKRPIASFDNIPSGCEPLIMTINNTSQNVNIPGTKYLWDFGDGGTSSVKNPIYTYYLPGVYNVKLIVSGPGGDSEFSQTVKVFQTPVALFDLAPTYVFVNDEKVRAINHSSGADYFVWEWGDGDTSKTKDPFHKYMESGVFDVSLSAYKDNGGGNICYSRYTMSPGVTVEPAGEIRFASVFRPNLTGPIDAIDLPTGGDAVDQFFYPPIRDKVDDYKLQIFNRLGVLIFESHDLNIPWNGYYKGQLCPQGVYVWYVEGKYKNGQVYKKVGDITLLH